MSQLIYFNLGVRCCKNFFFLRNLSISSKLFSLRTQNCSIICYSFNIYVPIVTSYLSFLILIIFFPLSILLAVHQFYWSFPRNRLQFHWLPLSFFWFQLYWCQLLSLFLSLCFRFILSFFLVSLNGSPDYWSEIFFSPIWTFNAINFLLNTSLPASQIFWYIVFSFFLLISSLIPLWSENILYIFSGLLWPRIWSLSVTVPVAIKKTVCSDIVGWSVLWMSIRSRWLLVMFNFSVSLLVLWITEICWVTT